MLCGSAAGGSFLTTEPYLGVPTPEVVSDGVLPFQREVARRVRVAGFARFVGFRRAAADEDEIATLRDPSAGTLTQAHHPQRTADSSSGLHCMSDRL